VSVRDLPAPPPFHGDETTELHASKPDRWPVGQYQAEVFRNGVSVYETTFALL